MEEFLKKRLKDVRRSIERDMGTEIMNLRDEMMFREEDWKREINGLKETTEKERNELKERIEKLEMRWVEYNKNGQNNMMQLEQENNTRDTFPSQSVQPTSDNARHIQCNNDVNLRAGTSGTSGNAQSQNFNISKANESNRPNVANTVSNTRKNNSLRIKSDDVNRSANKSNQYAPGNSRNVNNTDDDSAKIMCHCRKPAIQVVKKEGPYKNRPYYKCANTTKPCGTRCEFFLLISDSAVPQGNATNKNSSSVSNMDRNNADAGTSNNNSLTAQADPNKGQSFGVRRTVNFNNSHVYSRTNRSNSNFFKRPKLT